MRCAVDEVDLIGSRRQQHHGAILRHDGGGRRRLHPHDVRQTTALQDRIDRRLPARSDRWRARNSREPSLDRVAVAQESSVPRDRHALMSLKGADVVTGVIEPQMHVIARAISLLAVVRHIGQPDPAVLAPRLAEPGAGGECVDRAVFRCRGLLGLMLLGANDRCQRGFQRPHVPRLDPAIEDRSEHALQPAIDPGHRQPVLTAAISLAQHTCFGGDGKQPSRGMLSIGHAPKQRGVTALE